MENYFEPALTAAQLQAISSVGLAHMGDAVYEVLTRAWLCAHGKATGKGLHRAAVARRPRRSGRSGYCRC